MALRKLRENKILKFQYLMNKKGFQSQLKENFLVSKVLYFRLIYKIAKICRKKPLNKL